MTAVITTTVYLPSPPPGFKINYYYVSQHGQYPRCKDFVTLQDAVAYWVHLGTGQSYLKAYAICGDEVKACTWKGDCWGEWK